jgi:hypothetical protein
METKKEILSLFHALWGKAHDGPSYDKKEWLRLQSLLSELLAKVWAAAV